MSSSPRGAATATDPATGWRERASAVAMAAGKLLAGTVPEAVAARLRASVLRPLAEVVPAAPPNGGTGAAPAVVDAAGLDELIAGWAGGLATAVRDPDAPAAVAEAAAALLDLALRGPQVPEGVDRAARRAGFATILAGVPRTLVVRRDGPYLAVNCDELLDGYGLCLPVAPLVALCRCGASAMKPVCDGSHERVGFHPVPDPDRPRSRRVEYAGPAATVTDDRGLCSRSLLCSNRLANVFHQDSDPFVTPGAGRLDEIIRAVRECPSGALAIRVSGQEIEDAGAGGTVAVTKDGPYRVAGDVPLVDEAGAAVPRAEGAPPARYTLCRCGQTGNPPFCSGRHREVHFVDPLPDRDRLPTLFEWAGGMPAFNRLMRRFYDTYVPADPLLGPLFAKMGPDHPERVAAWVAEVFGAPGVYSGPYGGFSRMMSRHLHAGFSEPQRARFVELICKSAEDIGMPSDPEFRAAFVAYFEWGSRIATETSRPDANPPRNMQMPRWTWIRDAVPGARPPFFSRHETRPELVLPAEGETVRFAVHIRPQFRNMDRLAMIYAFDLWSAESVRSRATAILARLEDGTMPVDGAWTPEGIALFRRWIDTGMSD